MNEVTVVGGTKKQRELAEKVVEWSIKKMMPRMRTLDIVVSIESMNGDDAYGYCMEEDTNREFTLTIRKKQTLFEMIGTIVHEMIHVKQYARRELRSVHGNTMWKKKNYNNVSYADAPWEKEAFRLERKYALECFEELEFIL